MRAALMMMLITMAISSSRLSAQDAYRTNLTGHSAMWTSAANWQRFDHSKNTWVTADHYPTYLDGVITIRTGDSIQLFGAVDKVLIIDQVVVEKDAALAFLKNSEKAVVVNDDEGNDIVVDGKLYIEREGALRGKGNIQVNKGAFLNLKNNGFIGLQVNNNGTMRFEGSRQITGVFSGCTVVNNGTCIWTNGDLLMDSSAVFTNHGRMEINTGTDLSLANVKSATSKFINKGIILNGARAFVVNFKVKMENYGTLGGVGTFLFSGGVNAGGVISPGASPGHLTLGPGAVKSPLINIEIATTGAVPGVNYDRLTVYSLQDLNGATINVTDAATDSVNTEYTIIDATTSLQQLPYPEFKLFAPGNFTWSFKGDRLILKKIFAEALPVVWGGFKAIAKGNNVSLEWNAAMDKRTAYFVVEHSTNATDYSPVAKVDAQHSDAPEAQYKFVFANTDPLKTNYFRIKQVNSDGRSGHSVARAVKFDKGTVIALQTHADMDNNEIQLNIQTENVCVYLEDNSGKLIQQIALLPGQHSIYTDALPVGSYMMKVYVRDVMVEAKQILKSKK
ncbi:MAG: hypothetical protein DI535_25695 [Citrobacter freundii]|nr:MAG: hypothetical protein DI535_25695 [Citrobacter freundii]